MLDPIQPNSLLFIMLDKWVPALITVLVGALFASFLLPRVQAVYAAKRALTDKKLDLVGTVTYRFRKYIVAWRRLRQLAVVLPQPMDEEDRKRLTALATLRNERKDDLIEALYQMKVAFSSGLADDIDRFLEWDELQTNKELPELPDLEEWVKWERRIGSFAGSEARHSA